MDTDDSEISDSSFADHFSGHAHSYATFHPHYPEPLFDFLKSEAPNRHLVWDCLTGSGQAAVFLARYFDHIIATDANAEQLEQARQLTNIRYRQATAENSQLETNSVDLICVAQAAHWFDLRNYYRECRRVARPGAIIPI